MYKNMIKEEYKKMLRAMMMVVAFTAAALCPSAANAEELFADLAGMPQVESTYVSGRFAHNQKYWYSRDGQHTMNLSRGFSALYSYTCYSEESVSKARKILKDYLKKNPDVEIVMKTTQGSQEYLVYEKFLGDDKVTQMIIWSSDAPNTCEIVVIDWKNGLERSSTNHYSDAGWGGNIFPLRRDATESGLADLSRFADLGLTLDFSSLENMKNLEGLECMENLESLEDLAKIDWNGILSGIDLQNMIRISENNK